MQYTAKTNEEDISLHFVESLSNAVKKLGEKYVEPEPMIITPEEQAAFDMTEKCWICGKRGWEDNKVRDHCHFTGKFRGAAHSKCNLRLRKDKIVLVLFHNGGGYEFHLLVKNLGKVQGEISVIAKNVEEHISITKKIPIIEKNSWKIRFLDSCGFLQASLADLVKNQERKNFKITGKNLCEERLTLLLRKGVFPYEWFDDVKKLNETQLPPIEAFYSSLTEQGVSKEDY